MAASAALFRVVRRRAPELLAPLTLSLFKRRHGACTEKIADKITNFTCQFGAFLPFDEDKGFAEAEPTGPPALAEAASAATLLRVGRRRAPGPSRAPYFSLLRRRGVAMEMITMSNLALVQYGWACRFSKVW